eukprot:CAMPEP_0185850892 /NCGR_PEP_ID=MMETSP1354-20130828/4845_1 /TAXON_ID=708628 /ORGANISM="Erythrolobus madagascarensis, Strain CCMP3276" /LENGTH=683 /DNA_ID=CAMNT_0028551619 /DNA_START=212 /DNA_END=2263 /DNA_ORIENTATION=+
MRAVSTRGGLESSLMRWNAGLVVVVLLGLVAHRADAQGSEFVAGEFRSSETNFPLPVALSNGSVSVEIEFFLRPRNNDDSIQEVLIDPTSSAILTGYNATWVVDRDTFRYTLFNITVTFEFDYLPGYATYVMTVDTDTAMYSTGVEEFPFLVFGFVLLEPGTDINNPGSPSDNKIVSGLTRSFDMGTFEDVLEVDQYVLPVVSYFDETNTRFDFSTINAVVSPAVGTTYYEQVDWDASTCPIESEQNGPPYELTDGCGFVFVRGASQADDVFVMKVNPYRVGDFILDFDSDDSQVGTFETRLYNQIAETPVPPPVAPAGQGHTFNYYGWEILPYQFYNVFVPPRESGDGAEGGRLRVFDTDFDMNFSRSNLSEQATYTLWVQNIEGIPDGADPLTPEDARFFFEFAESGEGEVTQLPPPATVQFSSADACQAPGLNNSDPNFDIVEVGVVMTQYDPETTTQYTCNKITNALLNKFPTMDEAAISSISAMPQSKFASRKLSNAQTALSSSVAARQTAGNGTVVRVRTRVESRTSSEVEQEMNTYLDTKEFADDVFMSEEWTGRDDSTPSESPSGGPVPTEGPDSGATGALPTWAIAVISVIAGLLLILLIAVALFLLLSRGEDEDTESSYQSDGPALVPRPDDVMYQQAIVHDEYGRGEWSEPLEGEAVEMENGIRAEYPRIVA